jgi:putative ABC transport system permease protein
MKDSLYLAWRYLHHHRAKTLLLQSLLARAEGTPLLLGKKGSSLDLVVEALYFQPKGIEALAAADADEVDATGLALAIPMRTGLLAQQFPLVGTSLDYFAFRGLETADGRALAKLGECVIGADVAATLGLSPGDSILTSPSTLFGPHG